MNNKILLTIMIIVALLIAIYKWILSDDENNEEKQEITTEEVKEPASEKETVESEETTEEVKENGEDTVNDDVLEYNRHTKLFLSCYCKKKKKIPQITDYQQFEKSSLYPDPGSNRDGSESTGV